MIYFNGYLFKYELITMVTDIRPEVKGRDPLNPDIPTVTLYNFTIKFDGESVCFQYMTKEEAEEKWNELAGLIREYGNMLAPDDEDKQ